MVPLRIASLIADVQRTRSPLDILMQGTTDAILATDSRGVILGSSKPASDRLRLERDLPERITAAVRASRPGASVVRDGARAIYLSPCAERGVAWLIAIDGESWVEPPVRLTPRQRELLVLLDKGLINAEIAAALKLAAPTIKTMLERLAPARERLQPGRAARVVTRALEPLTSGAQLDWQVRAVRSQENAAFAPAMPKVVPTVTMASPPPAWIRNLIDPLTYWKSNVAVFT